MQGQVFDSLIMPATRSPIGFDANGEVESCSCDTRRLYLSLEEREGFVNEPEVNLQIRERFTPDSQFTVHNSCSVTLSDSRESEGLSW